MSETNQEPNVSVPGSGEPQEDRPETFDREYVEKLRKENAAQRAKAKENAEAAAELQRLRDAQKSAEERAAEREAAAVQRAADAEARALRREIALENRLEAGDAELLDGMTDEQAMRTLAARLSALTQPKHPGGYVPSQGTGDPAGKRGERGSDRAKKYMERNKL